MGRKLRGRQQEWSLGDLIGRGGYGEVFEARSAAGERAAAKFILRQPGADRELLFDLPQVRHVVPIVDRAETPTHFVIVMPRAEKSLLQHIDERPGPFAVDEAVAILADIAETLADLDGRVVHRDLKPANVLRLDGHWCLSDFGIAKYVEDTTAPETRKYEMSPPYAAPERWRGDDVTSAADVYAFGVIAHELLSGRKPFAGVGHELRAQHLGTTPAPLHGVPPLLAALVEECLYKQEDARPHPKSLLARLTGSTTRAPSAGLARLREAAREEAVRRGEGARERSEQRSEDERRGRLFEAAELNLARIATTVKDTLAGAAPSAVVDSGGTGWTIRLNQAELSLDEISGASAGCWGASERPPFDVIAHTRLTVAMPPDRFRYAGRSHSLWYCNAQDEEKYQWFETAFMVSPLRPFRAAVHPFALAPGSDAAEAIANGLTDSQLAWPFTPLVVGRLDDFLDRWAGYLAEASTGGLAHPGRMPERPVDGSWRTT
ncbi:protein kinase domain-containing protein [Amycolatopsis sp. CA-126428]|uniref:protein kinase domain-containing protein n=1 Tax=Amycolatopsis sp. CA-126428 TaxID=2073158 RepID=UPI000CD18BC8|nr:serine/threonine-protein kinase [Amycolatopsis sp. CA-126428]